MVDGLAALMIFKEDEHPVVAQPTGFTHLAWSYHRRDKGLTRN